MDRREHAILRMRSEFLTQFFVLLRIHPMHRNDEALPRKPSHKDFAYHRKMDVVIVVVFMPHHTYPINLNKH